METRPFGIQICLIEPGDHRSGSQHTRGHAERMGPESPYAAAYASATAKIHHDETHGSDPEVLGRKVTRMLDKKNSGSGSQARTSTWQSTCTNFCRPG